jgi:hypothetical protein
MARYVFFSKSHDSEYDHPCTSSIDGETDEAGFHEKKGKGIKELLVIMQRKPGYDIQRHKS